MHSSCFLTLVVVLTCNILILFIIEYVIPGCWEVIAKDGLTIMDFNYEKEIRFDPLPVLVLISRVSGLFNIESGGERGFFIFSH